MRRRRKRISQLQCSLPQQCSRVVHVGQSICLFFPVKKGEKDIEEEKEVEEENNENEEAKAIFSFQ